MSFVPTKVPAGAVPAVAILADCSNESVQYSTRRERREAERALEAQARVEAFAETLRTANAVNILPTLAAVHAAEAAGDDAAGETSREVEIPESFRAQWRSSRTRAGRMFAGRRVSGSTVALGLMAGTVVIGSGSAAAFATVASPEAGELTAKVAEENPASASLLTALENGTAEAGTESAGTESAGTGTASAESTAAESAAATAPEIEATSVTTFDSDTVAGLAVEAERAEVAAAESAATASSSTTAASTAQASVVWPVGQSSISSYYGARSAPTAGASSWHEGVDFVPGYGAAVGSMASGTVVATDYGSTSYGNYIDVEHTIDGQTVTTRYAHLSTISVSVGQVVAAGETIGNVGSTGVSTGAHLHFEVHVGGAPTDPLAYLQANAS